MSDIPAYAIVNLKVSDPDEYRKYEKGLFPILKRYGGELVTFDDSSTLLEGNTDLDGRWVILRFANRQAISDWYNDPDYQAISEHRRAGTTLRFLQAVDGVPPRG